MSELQQAFNVLEDLYSTNSNKDKIRILENNKRNDILKKIFYYTYNPFLLFQIKKLPEILGTVIETNDKHFEIFENILKKLANREVTGNDARSMVKHFFRKCNTNEQYWFKRILFKDLKVGATLTTANKVWPKLIPKFECQQANPYKGKLPEVMYLEPKLDGLRILTFIGKESDNITMFSRNGKMKDGYDEIKKCIKELGLKNVVLDGEIVSKNFNNSISEALSKKSGKTGVYSLFDIIPRDHFNKGVCKIPLYKRKEDLQIALSTLGDCNCIEQVEHFELELKHNLFESIFDEYYKKVLDYGFEGMMIKDANSHYRCKRTNAWLKRKPTETYDLSIIGVQEGTGRLEGTLGALICDFNGNEVHVGSGFSDELRDKLWKEQTIIIGKIVEVKAQEVTQNKSGTKSLRFPVFVKIREDKS